MKKKAAPMMPLSVRLPAGTRRQLDALCAHQGMSTTQVLILALDRLSLQELPPAAVEEGVPSGSEHDGK